MRIDRIELTNFRSFAGAVIELPTRVTFLIGANHRGKSSVLDAAKWALVGSCRGTAADGKGSDVLIRDAADVSAMRVRLSVNDPGFAEPFTIERSQNARVSAFAVGGIVGTRQATADTLLEGLGVSPAVIAACLDGEAFLDLHHADAKRLLLEVLDVKVRVETKHVVQGEPRVIAEELTLAELDRRYDQWYRERPIRKKALEAVRVPAAPEDGQLPDVVTLEQKLTELRRQKEARIAATAQDSGRRAEIEKQLAHARSDQTRLVSKHLGLVTVQGVDVDDAIVALEKQIAAAALSERETDDGEQARAALVDAAGRLRLLTDTLQAVKTHNPDRSCVLSPDVECRTPAKAFKAAVAGLQQQMDDLKTQQDGASQLLETLRVRQVDQTQREQRLGALKEQRRLRDAATADIAVLNDTLARLQAELDDLPPTGGPDPLIAAIQERIARGERIIADVRASVAARQAYETAHQARQAAAAALAEAERFVDLYGPKGARVAALEHAVADFHTRINEALLRFGYRLRIVPEPWLVLVNDRAAALLSKSERLQAGIAVQLAIAEISGFGFVAIDQVDLFDAENRRAFGALLDATPVQVLAAMTRDDGFVPPDVDDWTWTRLVARDGVSVVEPCGEAVAV